MIEDGSAADTPARRHGEDCDCTRCRGFAAGNDLSIRHGCYSVLQLQDRAEELAAHVREVAPLATEADSLAIDLVASVVAQFERASIVLSHVQAVEVERLHRGGRLTQPERDDLRRLSADARGWANTAKRYLELLGCFPASRTAMGLDVARTRDVLADYLAEAYPAEGEVE